MMTYKYYLAYRPDGSEKPGINRIAYDETGQEINREYVDKRPPEDQMAWASEEEIKANK